MPFKRADGKAKARQSMCLARLVAGSDMKFGSGSEVNALCWSHVFPFSRTSSRTNEIWQKKRIRTFYT